MKNTTIILVLLVFISCKRNSSNVRSQSSSNAEIIELAERYLELGRFSGSILVAKKSEVIFNQNFGYANHVKEIEFSENATFKVGLLSSLFVQAILKDLLGEGELDLSLPVSNFIKDYSGEMTLKMLIEDEEVGQKSDLRILLKTLIYNLSDDPIENLLEDLCSRLGATKTYYNSKQETESIGHLYQNNGNGLKWTISPIIKSDTISLFQGLKSHPLDLLKLIQDRSVDTIAIDGHMEEDGFSYSVNQKDGYCIVILSNTRHPIAKEMTKSIQAILANKSYILPLQRIEIGLENQILQKYQGDYRISPDRVLKFDLINDSLYTFMGPNRVLLKAQSENQFFMDGSDAAIKFISGEDGKINGAILLDGFLNGKFIQKIKE